MVPKTPVIRMRSTIQIQGINPFVRVTARHATRLKANWRRPLPVRITVNGVPNPPWRINLMPIGDGGFYLYLHAEVRKASGIQVGDRIEVEMQFDHDYAPGPSPVMPAWFVSALKRNTSAKLAWRRLTPSRQKEIARYLAGLKSEAARERNLQRVLSMLAKD
jgi:hypothetical protein